MSTFVNGLAGAIGGTSPGRGQVGSAVGCSVGDGGSIRSPRRLRFDGAPLPRAAVPPRPDILVVLADDLNERLFALLDRMQAIADRGMRFRATAPSPLCGPARATPRRADVGSEARDMDCAGRVAARAGRRPPR